MFPSLFFICFVWINSEVSASLPFYQPEEGISSFVLSTYIRDFSVNFLLKLVLPFNVRSSSYVREKGRYRYAGQWKHARMHGCGVYEVNERTIYVGARSTTHFF